MKSAATHSPTMQSVEYDLHGLVGIRLLDASPGDVAAVTRQLGPIQAPLAREPDILIRFVDRIATSSPMHYLGMEDVGFTDDTFLVLRSHDGTCGRTQIAFDQIGQRCEIVCERGKGPVPLLIPIVNLTALSNGAVPLHASAFTYNGTGMVVTGWSKGGKTEALLAFMAQGAEYIGDEWTYLSSDGERIYGLPEPMRIWDWHFQELPQYWARIAPRDRARLRVLQTLVHWMGRGLPKGMGRRSSPDRLIRRLSSLLKRQLSVRVPPGRVFGPRYCPLVGTAEKLFFVASQDIPDVVVQRIDPREVARRMVYSLQHERLVFTACYLKFRFAFPERRNEFVEQAEELERQMLTRALAEKEVYAVYHPYPMSLQDLFDAINLCVRRPANVQSRLDAKELCLPQR